MSTPVPGWYPDPRDPALARWWDGAQWSSATQLVESVKPRSIKPRRRIGGDFHRLTIVVQALLLVTVAVDAALIWGDRFVLDVADQFISRAPDPTDAATADRVNLVGGLGYLATRLITGIVFIRWLFVAHASDRMRPESQKHASGWAIGGWFVPVLNIWRPFGVTIDLRRGVIGPGAQATVLMWLWWLAVLASTVADRVAAAYWAADEATGLRGFGRELRRAAEADITSNAIDIVAALLAVVVVRQLTRMVRDAPVVS